MPGSEGKTVDPNALSVLKLYASETIADSFKAKCEVIREVSARAMGGLIRTTKQLTSNSEGYFFLTTERIVFVMTRGTFDKSYRVVFAMPYEGLATLETDGYASSTYVEITTQAGAKFRMIPKTSEPNRGLKLGSKLKELYINKMARVESEAKRVQIVLDFSFLRPLAEKGIVMEAIRCPYCSGPIKDLPSSGNIFDCPYCGNKIYAVDIYREINRLLGYTLDGIPSQLDSSRNQS